MEALVGRHEITGVGLLELAEPIHDRPAQNTDQQQNQGLPGRGDRSGTVHQSQDHYIDGGDLEHVEDGIKEPQYHRLADIALLFTGKAPDLSQNLDHACSPSFTPM